MRIWLLPIEPFEWRYTADWLRWWPKELECKDIEVRTIMGTTPGAGIKQGEFLDVTGTWVWKGSQVAALAEIIGSHGFNQHDVVLSLDGWGPATQAAAYMRDGLPTDNRFKLAVYMHAGAYDPHDFLARKGMGYWALDYERSIFRAADLVLVATEFHKRLICERLGVPGDNIVVVGLPIKAEEIGFGLPWENRPRRVLFPHRIAPEKRPQDFYDLSVIYKTLFPNDDAEFVVTGKVVHTKAEYRALLGASRVVFSAAEQETFGIAMQEGIAAGCWAVAPDRLSYPETLRGGGSCYDTLEQAANLVKCYLDAPGRAFWDGYHETAIQRAKGALKGRFLV